MTEEELQELDKRLELAKAQSTNTVSTYVKEEIKNQYEKDKQQLTNSEDFKQLTKEITERTAKAQLSADMLAVLSEEQKNELALFVLDCEKQKIEYRKKEEKAVILEEVKADVFNKKVEVLKKRYGYLYEKDNEGNILNFVPNKRYNQYRAFCNWWENTSDGFKKIVKGCLKIGMWTLIIALVGIFGVKVFNWIRTINIPSIG